MFLFIVWISLIGFNLVKSSDPSFNWTKFETTDHFFQSFQKNLSFWAANAFCLKNYNSNLATITSDESFKEITNDLKLKNITEAWIGLTDFGKEGRFYWISDYEKINTNFWEKDYPRISYESGDCVIVKLNEQGKYKWFDVHCAEIHNFVCMRMNKTLTNVNNLLPNLSHYTNQCNKPFFPVDGDCFWVTSENLTWNKSRELCQSKQNESDLATIRTKFQQEYFSALISGNDSAFWIGLQIEGHHYRWSLQQDVAITNWGQNEPNSLQKKCTYISGNEHQLGEWYSSTCSKNLKAICQTLQKHNYIQSNDSNTLDVDVNYDDILFQKGECEKEGYNYYHGSCYKLLPGKSASYSKAVELCKNESFENKLKKKSNANLVNFNNAGEKYLILSNLRRFESDLHNNGLWLGINGVKTEINENLRNKLSNYTRVPGFEYPSDSMKKLKSICFKLLLNGIVNASGCDKDSKARVMCKYQLRDLNSDDLSSNKLNASCTEGWELFHSYCFHFKNKIYQSQYEAKKQCMKFNSYLPSIDMHQQNFLKDYMFNKRKQDSNIQHSWIGLEIFNYSNSNIQYKWSNEAPLRYINIKNSQFIFQHNREKRWCTVFSATNGVWEVVNCTNFAASLICQKPAKLTPVGDKLSTVSTIETTTKKSIDDMYVKPGFSPIYKKLNWKEAKEECMSLKVSGEYTSNLANFKQYSEVLQLQNLNFDKQLSSTSQFWIGLSGLYDHFDNAFIHWNDKSSMVFQNFDFNNLMNLTGTENCVVMDIISGKWLVIDCSEKRPFICRVSLSENPKEIEDPLKKIANNDHWPGNRECPENYFEYPDKCFRVIEERMLDWKSADYYCRKLIPRKYSDTASLGSIESTYENSFVYSLLSMNIKSNSDTRYWIGEQYRNQGDQQQLCTAISGHPDPYIGARWFTQNCSTPLKFICSTLKIPTEKPKLQRKCPHHDSEYDTPMGTSCYQFDNHPNSLKEALNRCNLENPKHELLSIQSHYHMHFLRSKIASLGLSRDRPIWLGAEIEPYQYYFNWQWNNGQPVRYTIWNKPPKFENKRRNICFYFVAEKDDSGRLGMQLEECDNLTRNYYIVCEYIIPKRDSNINKEIDNDCSRDVLGNKFEGKKNTTSNGLRCVRWDLLAPSPVISKIINSIRNDADKHKFIQHQSNECRYIKSIGLQSIFCVTQKTITSNYSFDECNVQLCKNVSKILLHKIDESEHHSNNTLTVVLVTMMLFLCIILCIALLSWRRWNKGSLFGGYLRRSQFSFLNNQSRGTSFNNPIYKPINT